MEHLVLDEARLIAQSCRHYRQPYTAATEALQPQYGQPHQLAQSEIAAILNPPDMRSGDTKGFQHFALSVDLLVGMLISLEGPHGTDIRSTGHVDRLLSKLPKHFRDSFVEHLQAQGRLSTTQLNPYDLRDLANWLKDKEEAQRLSAKMAQRHRPDESRLQERTTSTSLQATWAARVCVPRLRQRQSSGQSSSGGTGLRHQVTEGQEVLPFL